MAGAAGLRALLWKDARRELRQLEGLAAGLVLVLLFLFVDLLAFPSLADQPAVAAVVLWTPILFGATAVVARGFASEADLGTLDLARSLPLPLALHGWSRTLLHLALLALLAALTAGVAAALFGLRVPSPLVAILALAVAGLAIVGTLASAIAAQARGRGLLLPILTVPVLAPLLMAGIDATATALAGGTGSGLSTPILLMAGYDLLAAGVAWFLWPVVLEAD